LEEWTKINTKNIEELVPWSAFGGQNFMANYNNHQKLVYVVGGWWEGRYLSPQTQKWMVVKIMSDAESITAISPMCSGKVQWKGPRNLNCIGGKASKGSKSCKNDDRGKYRGPKT
jgi:hypothetical protein